MTAAETQRMCTAHNDALLIPNGTICHPPVANINDVPNVNHHIVPVESRLPQRLVIPSASILGASVGPNGNQLVLQNDLALDLTLAAFDSAIRAIQPP